MLVKSLNCGGRMGLRRSASRPAVRPPREVCCTGDRFYDLNRAVLGDKVIHSAIGTRLVFAG